MANEYIIVECQHCGFRVKHYDCTSKDFYYLCDIIPHEYSVCPECFSQNWFNAWVATTDECIYKLEYNCPFCDSSYRRYIATNNIEEYLNTKYDQCWCCRKEFLMKDSNCRYKEREV